MSNLSQTYLKIFDVNVENARLAEITSRRNAY